jgi:hypothetical protein
MPINDVHHLDAHVKNSTLKQDIAGGEMRMRADDLLEA